MRITSESMDYKAEHKRVGKMTKEEFQRRWDGSEDGDGITWDDIFECAKEWGLFSTPKIYPLDVVGNAVTKAAGCKEIIDVRSRREMSNELKPCPFCGSEPQFWTWDNGAMIECWCSDHLVRCHAKTKELVIEAWNRREKDKQKELIERQAAIDVIHDYYLEKINASTTIETEDGTVFDMNIVDPILTDNKEISQAIKALPAIERINDDTDKSYTR